MTAIQINMPTPIEPPQTATFERVREAPNSLWQRIHDSVRFRRVFQAAIWVATSIVFVAVVLPISLLLVTISAIGLLALGLFSPALLHSHSAKIWRMAKNKIFGLLNDLFYLPRGVLISPLAFEPNVSCKQEGNKKTVVVFVHGFLHNKTCWNSLVNELQEETKNSANPIKDKDIYAINLGAPVTVNNIDHYSRYLATKLEKIRKDRKLDKLEVVLNCHSMGGLVAGHFAVTYASAAGVNVRRLISNGTPWHGTPMAYLGGFAKCGKEMQPNHPFQKKLAMNLNSIGNRIYTISSKGDTVVPYLSALGSELPIPDENRISLDHPFGHLGMLHSLQGRKANIKLITHL